MNEFFSRRFSIIFMIKTYKSKILAEFKSCADFYSHSSICPNLMPLKALALCATQKAMQMGRGKAFDQHSKTRRCQFQSTSDNAASGNQV